LIAIRSAGPGRESVRALAVFARPAYKIPSKEIPMTRLAGGVLVALFAVAAVASAQEPYPSRPITVVAPFPPGGVTDLTARPLAPVLEKILKQPVIITNKGGAAGAVGRQSVAIAKPDGYTTMIDLVS